MPEENQNEQVQEGTEPVKNDESNVPYARFKEVNEKAKTLENRLLEMETRLKKDEENKLLENNQFKELADKREAELEALRNEYEPLKAKEREMTDWKNAQKESLLLKIPEDKRETFRVLEITQLQAIVEELSKATPSTNNSPGTVQKKHNGMSLRELAIKDPDAYKKLTPKEKMEMARG